MHPWSALFLLCLCTLLSRPLCAENYLLTKHGDAWLPIVQVKNHTPYVMVGEALKATSENRYVLMPATFKSKSQPAPAWVEVRDLKITSRHMTIIGESAELNAELDVACALESAVDRDNVFIAVKIDSEDAGAGFVIDGLGSLKAGEVKFYNKTFRLAQSTGRYRYAFHVFSAGLELLHDELSAAELENTFRQRMEVQCEGVRDAAPRPYFVTKLKLPPKLDKPGSPVKVLLQARLLPSGNLANPVVLECTVPGLEEVALAGVRKWRFVPKLVNGQRVETLVKIPLVFTPSAKS